MYRFLIWLAFALAITACDRTVQAPKPRAYPRVIYPERGFQLFDKDYCQFSFQYPAYAQVERDSSPDPNMPEHSPCWFNLYIPAFDCRLHCSYYEIGKEKSFETLKQDAFELVDWHNKKANYIEEMAIKNGRGAEGLAFSIQGPAATPFQFYLTDNKTHFFRASLYFNTKINPDSLAPLYDFVLQDVMQIIDTFEWSAK